MKHLPFNEADLAGVTNTVNRYKNVGLKVCCTTEKKLDGFVTVAFENPVTLESFVVFQVHKLARKAWFRKRPYWQIQLYSRELDSEEATKRGCVSADTLIGALLAAENCVRNKFLSGREFKVTSEAHQPAPEATDQDSLQVSDARQARGSLLSRIHSATHRMP